MKKGPGKIAGFALRHLLRKPATISYPKTPLEIEKSYRGRLIYDPTECVGCNLCSKDCPAGAIKIVNMGTKEDKHSVCHLNVGHCIFCAQCVDSCRKGCLQFTQNIELGALNKDELEIVME